MDIWKGTIAPFYKHYDHEHGDWYEHAMAAGLILGFKTEEEGEYVDIVDYDEEELDDYELEELRERARKLKKYRFRKSPITGKELKKPQTFYAVTMKLGGKKYDYFVPAPSKGLPPSPKRIRNTLDGYNKNKKVDRSSTRNFR